MKSELPIETVQYDESHEGFVYSSWLRSYEHAFFAGELGCYPEAAQVTAQSLLDQLKHTQNGPHTPKGQMCDCLYCKIRAVAQKLYYAEHHLLLDRLIRDRLRPTRVLVAVRPDFHQTIFGWVCYEENTDRAPPIVHYVYVKELFRGLGIGRLLLHGAAGTYPRLAYTHRTNSGEEIARLLGKEGITCEHHPGIAVKGAANKSVVISQYT